MRASEERALVVERATTAVRARVQVVAWWRGESDVSAAASSRVNGCVTSWSYARRCVSVRSAVKRAREEGARGEREREKDGLRPRRERESEPTQCARRRRWRAATKRECVTPRDRVAICEPNREMCKSARRSRTWYASPAPMPAPRHAARRSFCIAALAQASVHDDH